MYYLQSRYYDPAIGRFINADSYASTSQGFLGYNMFAYCENDPINNVDYTGSLAFPGEIHNQVVKHVAEHNGLLQEQIILYENGFWGRADLVSSSGEVWEVKRDRERQIKRGESQLLNYVSNTWKRSPETTLSVGSPLPSDSFIYKRGATTYDVTYRYSGKGVIAYDYKAHTDWKTVGVTTATIVGIAILTYLTYQTGGATAPALGKAIEMLAK